MNRITRAIGCAIIGIGPLLGGAVSTVDGALMEGKVMSADRFRTLTQGGFPEIVSSGDFVVGPNVELEDFGATQFPPSPAFVDVDISDTQILITLLIDQQAAFQDTLRFLDSNNTIDNFGRVDINPSTTWAGLTPNRITNGGSFVGVDVVQLSGLAGQQILLDVIPEPASAALALTPLAILPLLRRRQRLSPGLRPGVASR